MTGKNIHFWLYIIYWPRCTGDIQQYPRINLSLWILFFHCSKYRKHNNSENLCTFPELTFFS